MRMSTTLFLCGFFACPAAVARAEWKVAAGPLLTRWAAQVAPDNALPEYPRPQMVRQSWQNLNGLWQYAITAQEAKQDVPYTHPDRPDKVMAMLAAVNAVVLSDLTPKRWEAGMVIMEMAARYEMDVALASARPLANAVNDVSGARLSAEFAHQLYPRIRRAMEN